MRHRGTNGAGDRPDGADTTTPTAIVHRARIAVALTFFLTGAISATWAARVPAIKEDLNLGDGQLAIALMGLNAGAVLGLQVGGLVVPRFGGRAALRFALPAFATSLVPLALAPSPLALTAAWFAAAAANSVVDVGMNAQGVTVERRIGRPVLSSLHAMHAVGGIAGGGISALVAWLAVSTLPHFVAVAGVATAVAVIITRLLLPASSDANPVAQSPRGAGGALGNWLRGWSGRTIAIGVLAFCITFAEGSILDWGAVYLHDVLGASSSLAASGLTVFLAGIALGRLAGDRLILWLGPVVALRASGLIAVGGFALALLVPEPATGVVGLGIIGFGISYLLPLLFSSASKLSGDESAAAIVARVSTLGYLGSFIGPALIGLLAQAFGLTVALMLSAALVASTVLAAGTIAPRPNRNRDH